MRPGFIILIFSICIFSCSHSKRIDFYNTEWKPVDSSGFFEYFTTHTTTDSGSNKRLVLKMVGWLNNQTKKIDSSVTGINFLASIADSQLTNCNFIKLLGENSTGYIKMNYKKWLLSDFKNEIHFAIYFPGAYSFENLRKDSLHLSNMNLFKEINIISSEKAIAKYEQESDTTWKQFLTANPLPVSLELKLNDSLLQKNKFDSVAHLLQKEFPEKIELTSTSSVTLLDSDDNQNTTLIFKFIIF